MLYTLSYRVFKFVHQLMIFIQPTQAHSYCFMVIQLALSYQILSNFYLKDNNQYNLEIVCTVWFQTVIQLVFVYKTTSFFMDSNNTYYTICNI